MTSVHLERCDVLPRLPLMAISAAAMWAVLVVVFNALNHSGSGQETVCMLRGLTGVPCPTCGGTRAVASITNGELLAAVVQNPLVTLGGIALLCWAIMIVGFRRRLVVTWTPAGRRAAWMIAVLIVLANWVYVITIDSPQAW